MKVIELPGHTGGTMGILLKDGTAFVGDAIKYISDAINRATSFAYYDINEANKSIIKILNAAKIIVPGHDIPFQVANGDIKPINEVRRLIIYLKGNLDIDILKV